MKQALLMNPDNMKDLLSGSSGPALAPGPAAAPGPGPQHSLGSSHSYFTSRRDWQAVTVNPSYDMHISRTPQLYMHCSKITHTAASPHRSSCIRSETVMSWNFVVPLCVVLYFGYQIVMALGYIALASLAGMAVRGAWTPSLASCAEAETEALAHNC